METPCKPRLHFRIPEFVTILVVAGLLPVRTTVPRMSKRSKKIRAALAAGHEPQDIAKVMAPGDERRQKVIRAQCYRILAHDEEIQAMRGRDMTGMWVAGMPGIVEAVIRRAQRGNVPAARLAMEASGYHNPKVQHTHDGNIKLTVTTVQRPEREVDVVDADVVE